jgi:hypothetical protein
VNREQRKPERYEWFFPPKIQHYELVVRFLVQHEDPEVGSVLQELTIHTLFRKRNSKKSEMQKWENLQLKKMWSLQPFRRIQADNTVRTHVKHSSGMLSLFTV